MVLGGTVYLVLKEPSLQLMRRSLTSLISLVSTLQLCLQSSC